MSKKKKEKAKCKDIKLFYISSTTSKEGVQGIRTGFFHFFESKEVRRNESLTIYNNNINFLRFYIDSCKRMESRN